MRTITTLITAITLLIGSANLKAEHYNIRGKVISSKGDPLESFCAQLLTSEDSISISGGWYMDGSYSIEIEKEGREELIVYISSLGYKDRYMSIELSDLTTIELPSITLEGSVNDLQEVVVTGRKNNFMQKSDRVVMGVENTPLEESGTALDILDRSVLLQVDSDNNVKLLSKGVAQIYLNGHKLGSNDQLAIIPSEDILSVEIIENPSAEYDGEATSVVNILTKKRRAILESGGKIINTLTKRRDYSNKTSIQYHISGVRHNFNSSYSFGKSKREYDNLYKREYTDEDPIKIIYNSDDEKKQLNQNHNIRLEDRYTLNSRSSISAALNSSFYEGVRSSENNNIVEFGDTIFSHTETPISGAYLNGTLSYEIDSTKTGKWELFGEFYRYRGEANSKIYEESADKQDNSLTRYSINAIELRNRYKLPNKVTVQSGVSYTNTNNYSDQEFITETLSNKNNYISREVKGAIWTSLYFTSNSWNFSGGIRGESLSRVSEMDGVNIVDKSDIDILPNFSMGIDLGKDFQIGLNYGKRLRHPSFSDLNPAIDYIDPLAYSQGNPELVSEKIHRADLKLSYMKFLSISTFYQNVDDAMVWFVEQDSDNSDITRGIQRNIDRSCSYGMNVVLPYQNSWLTAYVASGYSWSLETVDEISDKLKQNSWYLKSGLDLKLPFDFRSNITGLYFSDGIEGIWNYKGTYKIDANLERSFFENRFNVRLTFNDIFNSNKMFSEANFGYGKIGYSSYSDDSMVGLRISYKFKSDRKGRSGGSILDSERDRINGI